MSSVSDVQGALQKAINELFDRVSDPAYLLTPFDCKLLAFTGAASRSVSAVRAMAAQHGAPFIALAKSCAEHLERQIAASRATGQTLSQLGKALETYREPAESVPVSAPETETPETKINKYIPSTKDPINDDPDALANLGAWVAKALKR